MAVAVAAAVAVAPAGCRFDAVASGQGRAVVIAHRGASYEAPEHTTAAYDLAIEQGADYIEVDVARTRDGSLVVMHDVTVDRTLCGAAADCSGRVADRTLAELQRCDAGSWFNSAYPSRASSSHGALRMPSLAEVLDKYSSRTRLYIEIKDPELYPGIENDIVALLESRGVRGRTDGLERVYLQSFSPVSLRRVRALAPDLELILLIGDVSSAAIRDSLTSIVAFADGIGPRWQTTDNALVERAHMLCLVVHPYTVDDSPQMQSLLATGVDGMFTNLPAALRLVVDETYQAPGNRGSSCQSRSR